MHAAVSKDNASYTRSFDASGVQHAFQSFIRQFHKNYTHHEVTLRFEAFLDNYLFIRAHNAGNHSVILGLTQFADLRPGVFAQQYTLQRSFQWEADSKGKISDSELFRFFNSSLPLSVDWRKHGAVTAVKDQGHCGSCWAFAAVGALEGAWKIATGQLVSLSEQHILDCSAGNNGCSGGWVYLALLYPERANLCSEESYEYKGSRGVCGIPSCAVALPEGSVINVTRIARGDGLALMHAVAQQPVAVGIQAETRVFQLYQRGVLSSECGSAVNHAVLVVGYGNDMQQPYWLIKNSWGAYWGEKGYARLARGHGETGECGITSQPMFPVVDGSKGMLPGNEGLADAALVFVTFTVGVCIIFLVWTARKCKRRGSLERLQTQDPRCLISSSETSHTKSVS